MTDSTEQILGGSIPDRVIGGEVSAPASSLRAVLAHRAFRRLLLALAASQAGDWLYNVALLALVYDRTHSAAWLGATTAARVLPVVLLGPLGGVAAHRFDRRHTMIACDIVRAVLMLTLVAVAATDTPILFVPVLAGLAAAAGVPYPACTAASVPRLVPDSALPAANAARAALGPLCIVAGPAFGALLLLVGPASLVFAVNAATFLISAVAIGSLRSGSAFRAPGVTEERQHLLAEMAEGARALWANRLALHLVSADLLCSFVYGIETVALVLISTQLGLSNRGYGLLLAMIGAGGVLGSMMAARVMRMGRPSAVVAAALVVVAVPVAVLPLTSSLTAALLLAAVMGAASVLIEVITETVLQRSLDDAVFDRAYGFAFPVSIAGIAAGAAVAAPLVSWFGTSTAMLLIAAAVTAAAGLLALLMRRGGSPAIAVAPTTVAAT
jgi:predicted MFS family arabinose efflux permease